MFSSPSKTSSTTTSWNPVRFVSSDLESASPYARNDRSCLSSLAQAFAVVVSVSAFAICATFSASLLLSCVGATLLGLANSASGNLYTDLTIISLVVATACGAAVIAAAYAALALVLVLLMSMCNYPGVVVDNRYTAFSGGISPAFFAPAIRIAVTKGHVVGQTIELTAKEAMKMNGVGLGGVLACGLALHICSAMGITGALFAP